MNKNQELTERLNLVKEIFELSMKINSQGKYYCFFDTEPHVYSIEYYITPQSDFSKWLEVDTLIHYDYEDDMKEYCSHEELMEKLIEVKSKLEGYCE